MPDIPDWLQQWLKTVSAWDVALWVLGLVLAVWLIRRFITKGWPALKRFAKAVLHFANIVDAVQGLPKFIERTDATLAGQDQKIAEIHHEVHFNNGSSVKDSAVRTEEAVGRVEEGVKGLYDEIDLLKQADAAMRSDFEKTQPKPPTQGES
ncbi:hypothetical protein [Leifsonia sp. TF02-11]|uniref:hypothetical protein n=1 Tax=Leifsonia sp. TF02-11 TaxID=2815212 RepID=UPI001AA0F13B|nr:hypothetical protein [Leifsonia sp. TF02-11]MBO1739658.1 hypothetical protein [Leifsonia sp. TF02-11]